MEYQFFFSMYQKKNQLFLQKYGNAKYIMLGEKYQNSSCDVMNNHWG